MRVKQFLPSIAPTLTIVTSPLEHPSNRIVGLRRSGPGPDHVRMEDSHERVNILGVPGAGLAIDDRFDLFTDVFHRMTTESSMKHRSKSRVLSAKYTRDAEAPACSVDW